MCGITGWVAYGRNLTSEASTIEDMTATMACGGRARDSGAISLHPHAALGHRRLAVIDSDGGPQPMTVEEEGRVLVTLTYSGEIQNYRELRCELVSIGYRLRTRSDTEALLHAYLEWGAGAAERLKGNYAFAVWDARTEELLLVRDRQGAKPLYYRQTADGLVFGSEPRALLAHPDVHGAVDPAGRRELFNRIKTPGNAVYRTLSEVDPGHLLRVRREGVSAHRYAGPQAHEHTDDLRATIATVRALTVSRSRKWRTWNRRTRPSAECVR